MRVLALPAKDDMSSLLRITWPAETLAAQGADVVLTDEPWMIRERDRIVTEIEAPDCDVVVVCRPQHEYVAQSIPLLQAAGIAVVVDFDDDLTAVHRDNVAAPAFDPDVNAGANWRWALECCRQADLVTVSTPALLDVYAPHGRGIVLPNRIPSWRVPKPARHDGPPRLGWAGYIGTHPSDLTVLGGAATNVLRGRMQPFYLVGPGSPKVSAQLGGCAVRATGLVSHADWMDTVAVTLDVGIAPAQRSAFNLGKSCLKVLEGAACGVAMVASPTPDNRRAALDGLCVLAGDRREWEKQIRLLLDDGDTRTDHVERARAGLGPHLLERNVVDWWDAWTLARTNHHARHRPMAHLAP